MNLPSYLVLDATLFLVHEESGTQVALKVTDINDKLLTEEGQKECLEKAITAAEGMTNTKGWRAANEQEVQEYLAEKLAEEEEISRELMMRRLDDMDE